jgi:hypothetical protein
MMYAAIAWAASLLLILSTLLYTLHCLFLKCLKCCGYCDATKTTQTSLITPSRRFIASTVLLSIFCLLLVILLLLAIIFGLNELFAGTSEVADAPLGMAQIFYRLAVVMQPTFISIMSTVVLPTLQGRYPLLLHTPYYIL